jgi:SPX domain
MKFSRELEAQLVHEWRDGYVDYKHLKKIIKNIKVSLLGSSSKSSSESQSLLYGFSIADPIRAIATRFSSGSNLQNSLQVQEI